MALVQPFISSVPDSVFLPTISAAPVAEWANESARIATVIKKNRDNFFAALEVPMPFWQSAESQGGMIHLEWDASTDLQGDAVTYTATLSSSPDFLTIYQQLVGAAETEWTIAKPPNGTYYLKVTSSDSKGNTQMAFDRFEDAAGKTYFGVLSFQVTDAGVVGAQLSRGR
jgi:spore coat protein H